MVGEKWYEADTKSASVYRAYRLHFYQDVKECRKKISVFGLLMMVSLWLAVIFGGSSWLDSHKEHPDRTGLEAAAVAIASVIFLALFVLMLYLFLSEKEYRGHRGMKDRLELFWDTLDDEHLLTETGIGYLLEASQEPSLRQDDLFSVLMQSVVAPAVVTLITNMMTVKVKFSDITQELLMIALYIVVLIIGLRVGFPYVIESADENMSCVVAYRDDLLLIRRFVEAGKRKSELRLFLSGQKVGPKRSSKSKKKVRLFEFCKMMKALFPGHAMKKRVLEVGLVILLSVFLVLFR